jgi:hypothetical protein
MGGGGKRSKGGRKGEYIKRGRGGGGVASEFPDRAKLKGNEDNNLKTSSFLSQTIKRQSQELRIVLKGCIILCKFLCQNRLLILIIVAITFLKSLFF